jgi:hypothetical protein
MALHANVPSGGFQDISAGDTAGGAVIPTGGIQTMCADGQAIFAARLQADYRLSPPEAAAIRTPPPSAANTPASGP